jgi:hypothetical protein
MKFLPYLIPLTPLLILVGIAIYRNSKRKKLLNLIREEGFECLGTFKLRVINGGTENRKSSFASPDTTILQFYEAEVWKSEERIVLFPLLSKYSLASGIKNKLMLPLLLTNRAEASRFIEIPEHFYFLDKDDGSDHSGSIRVESDHYKEPIEFIFTDSQESIREELYRIYRKAVA